MDPQVETCMPEGNQSVHAHTYATGKKLMEIQSNKENYSFLNSYHIRRTSDRTMETFQMLFFSLVVIR